MPRVTEDGTTAVIVVDFQNEWSIPESPFYIGRVSLAAEKNRTLVHEALQRDLPVFYAKRYMEDRRDDAFNAYQERSDLHEKLPRNAAIDIVEHTGWDPFYETLLDDLLVQQGVSHVVISGLAINAGVRSCLESAYDRDYNITLMEDGCSAESHEVMQNTIDDIQRYREIFVDILQNYRNFL